jgi:hypothetical protein
VCVIEHLISPVVLATLIAAVGSFFGRQVERPGKEAPPEGPSGIRLDALPSCAAGLFTRTARLRLPATGIGITATTDTELNAEAEEVLKAEVFPEF